MKAHNLIEKLSLQIELPSDQRLVEDEVDHHFLNRIGEETVGMSDGIFFRLIGCGCRRRIVEINQCTRDIVGQGSEIVVDVLITFNDE